MSSRTLSAALAVALTLGLTVEASAQFWGRPSVPRSGVCFYQDSQFRGDYFCAPVGAVRNTVPYGTNDQISSIQVFGDAEVVVFRDINFRGASRVFDSSISDLRRAGFNDRVSSYRVGTGGGFARDGFGGGGWGGAYGGGAYNGGGYGGGDDWAPSWGRPVVPRSGACFYEGPNFNGRYFCSSVGSSAARVPPGANDKISSIRLYGNAEVTVFRDIDYNGQSRIVESDIGNLMMVGWNDRISSFRVTSAGRGGGWGGGGAYGGGGGGWNGGNWGGGGDWGGGRMRDSGGARMSHGEAERIVRAAYRQVLGRDPDPGAEGWITEVMNGRLSQDQLITRLRNSPEGRSKQ